MWKMLRVLCCLLTVLMFVSCGAQENDAGVSDATITTAATTAADTTVSEATATTTVQPTTAVSYYLQTASREYAKDTTEIEIVFGREDGEGFSYDMCYKLYRLQNGEWEQVAMKPTVTFSAIMLQVRQRDEAAGEGDAKATLTVDLTAFADPIDVGTYKIEKTFGSATAAAEFTVY